MNCLVCYHPAWTSHRMYISHPYQVHTDKDQALTFVGENRPVPAKQWNSDNGTSITSHTLHADLTAGGVPILRDFLGTSMYLALPASHTLAFCLTSYRFLVGQLFFPMFDVFLRSLASRNIVVDITIPQKRPGEPWRPLEHGDKELLYRQQESAMNRGPPLQSNMNTQAPSGCMYGK